MSYSEIARRLNEVGVTSQQGSNSMPKRLKTLSHHLPSRRGTLADAKLYEPASPKLLLLIGFSRFYRERKTRTLESF